MKKIIESLTFIFITIITSSICVASAYHFEINANRSSVEAKFDVTTAIDQGSLTTGVSTIYDEDDYKILSAGVALGDEILAPGLKCSLGFKGVLGQVEEDQQDSDVMAISFLLSAVYDIPETLSPIPIKASAGICVAPEPLCFLDSDRYLDIRTSLSFYIIENGAIIVGYRRLKIHFDNDNPANNWEMSDDALFVGYRLRF